MNVTRFFIAINIGENGNREKPSLPAPSVPLLLLLLLLSLTSNLTGQTTFFSDRTGSIEVTATPEEAEILLENEVVGTGEAELSDLKPGSYKVSARLEGYYNETAYVTLSAGEEAQLEFELTPMVGSLDLRVTPGDATILVGEKVIDEFPTELPVGVYTVEARRFGYVTEAKRVLIGERTVETVEFELAPAPFEISNLSVSKSRFNPDNPGRVGMTQISFEVSSYGRGTFEVYKGEAIVYREELESFTSRGQEVSWDGRGMEGQTLPGGNYRFEITARGNPLGTDETVVRVVRGEVAVDPRIISRYRSLFSGSAGLLYAPLAEPLGPGTAQITTHALAYSGNEESWYVPVVIGTRFGLGVPSALTLTAGPLISSDDGASRVTGSVAFSRRYFQIPRRLSLATVLKGSVASPVAGGYGGRDERTSPTGVGLQHPVTLYLGSFYLTLAPELFLGPDGVSYAEERDENGGLWSYLRGGIGYDGELLSFGVSAAVRSSLLTEEWDYDPPIPLGAEVHFSVPSSPLYLSLLTAADLYPKRGTWNLKGGVSAGILF